MLLDPVAVALGEVAVVVGSAFEAGDCEDAGVEGFGDDAQGVAGGLAAGAEVIGLDGRLWVDKVPVDLAGDEPLQAAQNRSLGLALAGAA